ncbi:MAG: hypothetical protein EU536_01785 [Promethearchaeota archaeon]|nr:MAG: hypothetical protein EU536_01785 [Candidatus Lokiarchaeota archaeon]
MERINVMKFYSLLTLLLNILAIGTNLLSYLGIYILNFVSIISFLVAFSLNLGFIYLCLSYINRKDTIGRKITCLCRYYLVFCFIAVLILFTQSASYSFIAVGHFLRELIFVISLFCYFGILVFGLLANYVNCQNINRSGIWK